MTEPDRTIIDPVVRLMAYGAPEGRIRACIEYLPQVTTPDELDELLGKLGTTIDWAQLLMFVFIPIYQHEPPIQKQAQEALHGMGIPNAIVDEYLGGFGTHPYLMLRLKYGDSYPEEVCEPFINAAAQVVLNTVKSYLGLMPKEPQPGP
ncbi:MAG: hypothetical protein PHE48_03505 [Candidatus Daviesbacteria bacterium]|nr:hypothetical protein [Candidatus Daviesbacteria bacterium]